MSNYRPRRSASEWLELIEAQRQSGLSAPSYCEENNIGYASFIKWRQQLSDSPESRQAVSTFVELAVDQTADEPDSPWLVELQLGANVHLRIAQPS